mmetsp:Transcript_10204/g.17774  ORF Transcript_10204/g.17774 Transcript_10204/m.17774 type:complete len:106 (-) Transcript_10204:276-593(-)|eukprot:CAMPEP_0119108592 /NCGR_PEP_ID=MMETSP1180-20130426/15287_1 /TAXON_ID=3052 ORGANISM="Chlamydomonas cf sp, Strain CCMP681" /NCGR_SAMPLE_ID=MMETSP1180 /ASSEMBLY_ACC=CAM_ASM_000741 /LENGTH=105 /DNA_ID=CAMNT_0007094221 /DNA_START=146 /DNA_END=463 /DNA_ORIENTATION=-
MGKAKPAHHTSRELADKARAALTNMGGGKNGQADRLGGKAGHSKFCCHVCKTTAPSLTNMKSHFEAKHPLLPWEPEKCSDLQEIHGGTTQGIAVRGSTKHVKETK